MAVRLPDSVHAELVIGRINHPRLSSGDFMDCCDHEGCTPSCVPRHSQTTRCLRAGDFVDHLLRSIEDDTPSFVGLSIEMAVVACVILLVSGVTGG